MPRIPRSSRLRVLGPKIGIAMAVLAGAIGILSGKGDSILQWIDWLEMRTARPAAELAASSPGEPCTAEIAVHRANYRKGEYPENSRESVEAALKRGLDRMEVDIVILKDGVVMRHDPTKLPRIASIHDFEGQGNRVFPLHEFMSTYAPRFKWIAFDIKEVHVSNGAEAVELLGREPFRPDSHVFIGHYCRLLQALERRLGIPGGCEGRGIISNKLMGLSVWSARFTDLNSFQLALNRFLGLYKVFWTFDDRAQYERYCFMRPDTVLIDML